jgi:hypothetical protein
MTLNIELSSILYEFNIHEQGIINLIVSYEPEYERELLRGMMIQYLIEEKKKGQENSNLKLYIKKLHKLSYNNIHKIIYKNKQNISSFDCTITYKPDNPLFIGRCLYIANKYHNLNNESFNKIDIEKSERLQYQLSHLQMNITEEFILENIKLDNIHHKCKFRNLTKIYKCVFCQGCKTKLMIVFNNMYFDTKSIIELLDGIATYKFMAVTV